MVVNDSPVKGKKHIVFFIMSLFFCIVFVFFSFIVKKDFFTSIDFNTTVRIQNHIPSSLDRLLASISFLGKFQVVLIALSIVLLLRKKIKNVVILILFGVAHIVELVGKIYLDHPGPPFMFYRLRNEYIFDNQYVQGPSYPSGHSFRAVFFALILTYLLFNSQKLSLVFKLLFSIGIWTIVLFISIGKVSLGEHWSSDVIGGILLGLSFGFLAVSTLK